MAQHTGPGPGGPPAPGRYAQKLRAALQQDRADLLDKVSRDIAEGIESRQTRVEWARLNVQLRFGGRPPRKAGAGAMVPYYKKADSRPVETADELAAARLQACANKEYATIQTPSEVVATCTDKHPPGATGPVPQADS